jgi:hypothetical protein
MNKVELDRVIKEYGEVASDDVQIQLSAQTQKLSRELVEKMNEAARVKEYLLSLHRRIKEISFGLLPNLFNEQNLSMIGVSNGVVLELKPYFKASLPVGMDPIKREEALTYLREKAPDILKTEISFSYGYKEHGLADKTIEILRELDLDPRVYEGVHHATLTSWVKEQFMSGEEVPFKTLNAKVGSVVRIHMDREEDAETLKRLRRVQNDSLNMDAEESRSTEAAVNSAIVEEEDE